MIPADHITFNDDGTAWLVESDFDHWITMDRDRPCDTCQGEMPSVCYDCIDGRHTFNIEVGLGYAAKAVAHIGETNYEASRTYSVTVVPGMVLSIVASPLAGAAMVELPNGSVVSNALPPAAKPGMWAVQLKVVSR